MCFAVVAGALPRQAFQTQWVVANAGGAAPLGWTDPTTYEWLLEMETTNTTQTLDTGSYAGGPYNASNYPSVAAGPSWTILGTNQYGRIEHGYLFDGADDRFYSETNFSGAIGNDTNGTVSFWVKPAAAASGDDAVLITQGGGGTTYMQPYFHWAANTFRVQLRTDNVFQGNGEPRTGWRQD